MTPDPTTWPDRFTDSPTPVIKAGRVLLKRDDLFMVAGAGGGKARTCWSLSSTGQAAKGLVTAGSRSSPQVNIVAHIARRLGLSFHAHVPQGILSPELEAAELAGAKIIQHQAGYNNVIIARARADAIFNEWREIPFGMECQQAVNATGLQVASILPFRNQIKRIVIPVGSAMSLCGLLYGLRSYGMADVPVLGIIVGAAPQKRIAKWAPPGWRKKVFLRKAKASYSAAKEVWVQPDYGKPFLLDPHYEAKCWEHAEPGDLFWIVGLRQTSQQVMLRATGDV